MLLFTAEVMSVLHDKYPDAAQVPAMWRYLGTCGWQLGVAGTLTIGGTSAAPHQCIANRTPRIRHYQQSLLYLCFLFFPSFPVLSLSHILFVDLASPKHRFFFPHRSPW